MGPWGSQGWQALPKIVQKGSLLEENGLPERTLEVPCLFLRPPKVHGQKPDGVIGELERHRCLDRFVRGLLPG